MITIERSSVEYLRFPFDANVDASSLSTGQVTFVPGDRNTPLPESPTWINATIVTTAPAHLRVLHGTDVTLTRGLTYTWFARFSDSPEAPVERGRNLIRCV